MVRKNSMRLRSWGYVFVVCIATLAANLPAVEATGVKKGTKGIVEVEYVMTAKGSQKTGDAQRDWRGTRTVAFSVEVVAGDLQEKPVFMAFAPVGSQSVSGKAQATQQKHEKTLGSMEAEIAKCKGDPECERRVAMSFMSSTEGSAMMRDMNKVAREASGGSGPRYQHWSGVDAGGKARAASGTYKVDEWYKAVVYDPGCGKTKNLCTTVLDRKGEGKLSFDEVFAGELKSGGVAVDTQKGLFTISFPSPMSFSVEVKDHVESTQNGSSSTKTSLRILQQYQKSAEGKYGAADLRTPGALKEMKGETTIAIKDVFKEFPSRDGQMTIRWRFSVKP